MKKNRIGFNEENLFPLLPYSRKNHKPPGLFIQTERKKKFFSRPDGQNGVWINPKVRIFNNHGGEK